jgi:hypothetical protein
VSRDLLEALPSKWDTTIAAPSLGGEGRGEGGSHTIFPRVLLFGSWGFSGAWSLEFGGSL